MLNFVKKDFKLRDSLKIYLLIVLAIVLIGLVVRIVFNYNLGTQYAGGLGINVQIDDRLTDEAVYDKYAGEISQIISTLEDESGNSFEICVQDCRLETLRQNLSIYFVTSLPANGEIDVQDTVIAQLQKALNEKYVTGVPAADAVTTIASRKAASVPSSYFDIFANLYLVAPMLITLIAVYFTFRFSSIKGLAAFFALAVNTLLYMVIFALTRIPLTESYALGLAAVLIYSIVSMLLMFHRLRENREDKRLERLTDEQITLISLRDILPKTLLASIAVVVGAVAVLASTIGWTLMPVALIVGLGASFFCSHFLMPSLWLNLETVAAANKARKNKKTN